MREACISSGSMNDIDGCDGRALEYTASESLCSYFTAIGHIGSYNNNHTIRAQHAYCSSPSLVPVQIQRCHILLAMLVQHSCCYLQPSKCHNIVAAHRPLYCARYFSLLPVTLCYVSWLVFLK